MMVVSSPSRASVSALGSARMIPTRPENRIKVLLVEDCRLVRIGIRALLEEHPEFELVGEVDNGETALELLATVHPDIMLIDIGLPGISGIETMKRLQVTPNKPRPRCVMLTAHQNSDEVLQSVEAGARAYCIKNISSERLKQVLLSVHEGAAWFDPAITDPILKRIPASAPQEAQASENAKELLSHLNKREQQILRLIVEGMTNSDISQRLHISVHTAKFHVSNLLEKLGVEDRVQVAVLAVQKGLIQAITDKERSEAQG
jgi:DNA-binding NarL/FixJ family response regulator